MSLLLAIALGSAAAPAPPPLGERQAADLVFKALPHIYPGESVQCFRLMIEGSSRASFDFAVREVHNRRCGGDPNLMHVRDRFRVGRSPPKLSIYDLFNDTYQPCRLSAAKQPRCKRPEPE